MSASNQRRSQSRRHPPGPVPSLPPPRQESPLSHCAGRIIVDSSSAHPHRWPPPPSVFFFFCPTPLRVRCSKPQTRPHRIPPFVFAPNRPLPQPHAPSVPCPKHSPYICDTWPPPLTRILRSRLAKRWRPRRRTGSRALIFRVSGWISSIGAPVIRRGRSGVNKRGDTCSVQYSARARGGEMFLCSHMCACAGACEGATANPQVQSHPAPGGIGKIKSEIPHYWPSRSPPEKALPRLLFCFPRQR